LAQRQFNIVNFIKSLQDGVPDLIYVFGEDRDQRLVVTMLLRSLVTSQDGVFVTEFEDSKLGPSDLQELLCYNELFGDRKAVYLDNFASMKNFKKASIQELRELNGGGVLILDSCSKNLVRSDLAYLEEAEALILECSPLDADSSEYKIMVGVLIDLLLGFRPRADSIDFLSSKKYKFGDLWHLLMALRLSEDDLSKETLVPELLEGKARSSKRGDIDFFLFSVLTKNLRSCLGFVDTLFFKEDKTTYLLYYLAEFFEKLYSIKVRKNISPFELSSLLKIKLNKAKAMKEASKRWSKFKIEESLRLMYKVDKYYTQSSRSKVVGRTQVDQLLMKVLSD